MFKKKQKRDYFSHVLKEKLMMIRKRANQGMILNLDGMDGMRISNVTYCKLNKRLKTLHFFERKKILKINKRGGWNKNFPGRKISKN